MTPRVWEKCLQVLERRELLACVNTIYIPSFMSERTADLKLNPVETRALGVLSFVVANRHHSRSFSSRSGAGSQRFTKQK